MTDTETISKVAMLTVNGILLSIGAVVFLLSLSFIPNWFFNPPIGGIMGMAIFILAANKYFNCLSLTVWLIPIALVGALGALKQDRYLLWTYLVLSILSIYGCSLYITKLYILKSQVDLIPELYDEYYGYADHVDYLQKEFLCCGAHGPKSFQYTLPASCCPIYTKKCTEDMAYQEGCVEAVTSFLNGTTIEIYVSHGVAAFFFIAGVVWDFLLLRSM